MPAMGAGSGKRKGERRVQAVAVLWARALFGALEAKERAPERQECLRGKAM